MKSGTKAVPLLRLNRETLMKKASGTTHAGRFMSDAELARISAGKLDYSTYSDKELLDLAKMLQDQVNDALENPTNYHNYQETVRVSMQMLDTLNAELAERSKRAQP
jgi:hypothetical protein